MERKQFLSLIIVFFIVNYVDSQCEQQTPCHCIRSDGMGLNLTAVATYGSLKSDNGSVAFHPCKNVNLTFANSVLQPAADNCQNTSLCLLDNSKHSINLGTMEETYWIWPPHQNPELKIHHKNRESHIELICSNSGDETIFRLLKADPTVLKFQLSSDKLCIVDMRPKSLSTGSLLVILFFVFTGMYFIGGGILLRCFRGAVGKEIVPNYEFWADLPALVRDGVTFTLSGCSAVSYERI